MPLCRSLSVNISQFRRRPRETRPLGLLPLPLMLQRSLQMDSALSKPPSGASLLLTQILKSV